MYAWNGPETIPLPRSSPFTRTLSAPIRTAMRLATPTSKVKQHAARMTTIIKIEKLAKASERGTNGANQLAARRQSSNKTTMNHKSSKLDRKTAGKPLKLAMITRISHK